ncbi:DUF4398 domain-containing protein [Kaarinaea lacus]
MLASVHIIRSLKHAGRFIHGMDCNRYLLMGVINRKIAVSVIYVGLLMALISCVSAPVQEMSDARQAIQAAKEGGANPDSTANLTKAESLLKEAEAALESGEYKKARLTATEARNEAIKAQQTSP